MNKQEIFDKVYAALLEQKVPSIGAYGSCLYRGQNGTKCAVGHLIPDELFDQKFNRMSISCLPKYMLDHIGLKDKDDIDFIADLQRIHDMKLTESLEIWHQNMLRFAEQSNLQFNFPKELA